MIVKRGATFGTFKLYWSLLVYPEVRWAVRIASGRTGVQATVSQHSALGSQLAAFRRLNKPWLPQTEAFRPLTSGDSDSMLILLVGVIW